MVANVLNPRESFYIQRNSNSVSKNKNKKLLFSHLFSIGKLSYGLFFFYIEELVLRFGICFKSVGVWNCINLLSLPPFLQQTDKGFDRAAFESQMSVMRGQVGHCLILFIKNVRLESYQLSPTVTRSVAPHATCNAEPRQLRRYLVLV